MAEPGLFIFRWGSPIDRRPFATPPIGKTQPPSKIAVTLEPTMQCNVPKLRNILYFMTGCHMSPGWAWRRCTARRGRGELSDLFNE